MRHSSFGRALYELLSSMRFAISLLVIIAIAAIVGTVLLQNQAYTDYIVQFGEFWFKPFEAIGLFDVYHAGWFLGMLAFLVTSTSLCIYRHVPGILRDIRLYREHATLKSLRAMGHHAEFAFDGESAAAQATLGAWLTSEGYRVKPVTREDGVAVVGKKGSMQRLGYLLAHSAIVVGCLGFLLDGDPLLKMQRWLGTKQVETRNIPASQIPTQSRLPVNEMAFRANMDLPEGQVGDVAFVNAGRGYFVQELPFVLRLKQFHIEHYSTGQPKLFASDIEVTDKATGKVTAGTVQVNHPLIVDGIAIYQSSFGDGGSPLAFTLWDWAKPQSMGEPFKAVSQGVQRLDRNGHVLTLEFEDFRPFNVESTGDGATPGQHGMGQRLEDAREVKAKRRVKNIGPSIQFKVRDAEGQAHEYLNYLAPFEEDGHFYLLSGMRTEPSSPFGYIRIPLDGEMKPDTFMRLRAVMLDPARRAEIAERAASRVDSPGAQGATLKQGLQQGLAVVLQNFAQGGLDQLNRFVTERFPADRREGASRATIELLQRAEVEAMNMAQTQAGLPTIDIAKPDEQRDRFLLDALGAMSDGFGYGSDFYLQPVGFTEVKSSGFQLARSPGQPLVYLGSVLLVLGIFCMFYIRENRVWVWLGQGRLLIAFSSNRRDDQTDREFAVYQAALRQLAGISELST